MSDKVGPSEAMVMRSVAAMMGFDPESLISRFRELGIQTNALTERSADEFASHAISLGKWRGIVESPRAAVNAISLLLNGRRAQTILDPWAEVGLVVSAAQLATGATKVLAFTRHPQAATIGQVCNPAIEWHVGDPSGFLVELRDEIDVVASCLPFGLREGALSTVSARTGTVVALKGDLATALLVQSALKLRDDGIGVFVVPQSLLVSSKSPLPLLGDFGLGIHAALALPAGAFSPFANIATYVVVVDRHPSDRMFVAQLTDDPAVNLQVVQNLKDGVERETVDMGRYVPADSFCGISGLRLQERLRSEADTFGSPSVSLADLSAKIQLGRSGGKGFEPCDGAIYIPVLGPSRVVESVDEMTLKQQNYAQVVIDPAKSSARFVARFLNTEIGRSIRLESMTGSVIRRLTLPTIRQIRVFVPPLEAQGAMLEVEAAIAAERNTILSLGSELDELRQALWADSRATDAVRARLAEFSDRVGGRLREHAASTLEEWGETLPFPLASILRAWQATPRDDAKTRYEHLLHLFEATAEFSSVVLLSAYATREALFGQIKSQVRESLAKNGHQLRRATFGTWTLVVGILAKRLRELLNDDDGRKLLAEMFSDDSLALPEMLAKKELLAVISAVNAMRNNGPAHGGVVGPAEAQFRNETLLGEVAKLRSIMGETWTNMQMIRALHCRPRRGIYETEMALLTGSNSDFVKETRTMAVGMDVDLLYLARKGAQKALPLLPLVQLGPSPSTAKNACYFFNRAEKDGLRFVSYHFVDQPEMKSPLDPASAIMQLVTEE